MFGFSVAKPRQRGCIQAQWDRCNQQRLQTISLFAKESKMGKCIFSFDKIELLNQKSDTNHSDNDWLSMTWSINDKVYSKTISLRNIAGTQVLHSGDVLSPFQDYVVCNNTDTVIVTYSVINLSSYDWGEQAEAAADFTK